MRRFHSYTSVLMLAFMVVVVINGVGDFERVFGSCLVIAWLLTGGWEDINSHA